MMISANGSDPLALHCQVLVDGVLLSERVSIFAASEELGIALQNRSVDDYRRMGSEVARWVPLAHQGDVVIEVKDDAPGWARAEMDRRRLGDKLQLAGRPLG